MRWPCQNFANLFDADKTRMIGLPCGEETMTLCLAVSIEYRNVTDGRTDRQTDIIALSTSRVSVLKHDKMDMEWPVTDTYRHLMVHGRHLSQRNNYRQRRMERLCIRRLITSSTVVAKRSRDASFLSVVSFNGTKRRAQSFIVSYVCLSLRTIKCCSVVFGVKLSLLVIYISSSYPAINKLRRLLPAISVTTCHSPRRHRVDNT